MQTVLFFIYYATIVLAFVIGLSRYRRLDTALRYIVLLMGITSISELLSHLLIQYEMYKFRYAIFHLYSILELLLITLFFIYAIKPHHYRKLILAAVILCPFIAVLNIVFLQPIDKLNTNMLMFESFAINTMSLYLIYIMIKKNSLQNIFKQPGFKIALLLLIAWSSTFFFWAFVSVLYIGKWPFINAASYIHTIIDILVYSGFAIIFYFHPPKTAPDE